MIYIIMLMAVI